ncbi:Cyclin-dependent kinase 15 [Characodon lateralis]|uniref:Cyclin-dependent kinase 15 n=1 Tax=Characodon lateralis TaxID=208331 RepID=A0ABU7EEW7_9TELE|nr:Cyclin-dependent kinase 15 [Characodon lateralis]
MSSHLLPLTRAEKAEVQEYVYVKETEHTELMAATAPPSGFSQRETLGQEDHCMLEQLSYKTEDLVQKILKLVPTERISAQESMQHPYFSTLPAPIMHLRDTVSIFKVSGVRLETEVRDIFNPGRRLKSSLLPAASCW